MQALLGRKIGMARVFDEEGGQRVVTAIKCGPCVVLRRKRAEKDGYDAVQVGFENTTGKRIPKAQKNIFEKLKTDPMRHLAEFKLDAGDDYKEGDVVSVSIFDNVKYVDVTGITKGKGFQGVMRRHGMSGGPAAHGGHSKRRIGGIGARELPGRVHKGKRMAGHMGNVRRTLQNLKVVRVVSEDNVILVGGGVPGHAGSILKVARSVKKGGKA